MQEKMSQSLEDYLETIYRLSQSLEEVRITDIAGDLELSKPSVNRAVGALKEQGYVEHEHYGKISLTKEGEEMGKKVYKRHLLLKSFLMNQLGVDRETAEADACRMEHVMSEKTVRHLIEYIRSLEKN